MPLAQYDLAQIYDKRFKDYNTPERLLDCAAKQDFSAAMRELSMIKEIRYGNLKESLLLMHNAVRQGGEGGGKAALNLTMVYAKNKALMDKFIATPADPVREAAYAELEKALMGQVQKVATPSIPSRA